MRQPTDNLDARGLLEWLLACRSLDDGHAAIRSWLRVHPAPPAIDAMLARVDATLEGWYRAEYDPRVVSPALEELVATAEGLAPGRGSLREWVDSWAHQPHESLGGQSPVRVLNKAANVTLVRELMIQDLER